MSENDTVRPGPQRWLRAVKAAVEKPDSYHAELLFERLNRVKHLVMSTGSSRTYWKVERYEKNHYYCSDFCAALASHLEAYVGFGADYPTYEALIMDIGDPTRNTLWIGWTRENSITSPRMLRIKPEQLPRAVKCFTCGGKMATNRVTSVEPLVDFSSAITLAAVKSGTEKPLEDWERVLLHGAPDPAPEQKETVYLDSWGSVHDTRPEVVEVQLTAREKLLLEWVGAQDRHNALKQLAEL